MSNSTSKGYQFTLLNGQITSVSEIKNGRVKFEHMDADEAWSYDAASGQVSKTEWDDGRLETTLYADANGDGIFNKISKSYGALNTGINTLITELGGHHGSLSSDDLQGSDFDDAYHGEGGNDHIDGQDGDDNLYGDAGHDSLTGGDGDDILVGGRGTDDLAGGNGADVFDFNDLTELGLGRTHDTVQDFQHDDHDKIDLSDMDAHPLLAGNQTFVFLGSAPGVGNQTGTAWFDQGNLYLSTDADSAAEFQIAVVGVSALTTADLVL